MNNTFEGRVLAGMPDARDMEVLELLNDCLRSVSFDDLMTHTTTPSGVSRLLALLAVGERLRRNQAA